MNQDFNLAKVFADLANDPSWPWELEPTVIGQTSHKTIIKWGTAQHEWFQVNDLRFASFVAQSPLTMARLALMVVEGFARSWFYRKRYGPTPDDAFEKWDECIGLALEGCTINPDHYANVKKRVENSEK